MTPIKLLAAVMLISLMLDAGLQANREHLLAALKNYGVIGRALLANFIIVPVLGVLAVRLFQLNGEVATGVLLMAIAPGVPLVVYASGRKKGGSLGLAIALAILMPVLTVVTFPITAPLVLPAAARMPAADILRSLLLFQLLPLLIGMVLARRTPGVAERLARPVGVIFLVTLIALLSFLAPAIAKSVASVYGSRAILAMLVVVVLSIVTGWILGGPVDEYRRTVSIATALRNIGLCLVIATTDFPGTLVGPTVMTYLVIQAIVSSIIGAYFKRTAGPVATAAT
jgi:bile acid:Na+ symporter, BASS family